MLHKYGSRSEGSVAGFGDSDDITGNIDIAGTVYLGSAVEGKEDNVVSGLLRHVIGLQWGCIKGAQTWLLSASIVQACEKRWL